MIKKKKLTELTLMLVLIIIVVSIVMLLEKTHTKALSYKTKTTKTIISPTIQAKSNLKTISSNKNTSNKETSPPDNNVTTHNEDYKSLFSSSVFVGDSITQSLSYYNLLNDENVNAKIGLTLYKAKYDLGKLDLIKPKNVFILFGENDMEDGTSCNTFIKHYAEVIHAIKSKVPNANIYIQSILPVTEQVKIKKPYVTNTRISEFNKALIDLAKTEHIYYINIASALSNVHKSLYEPDGIHFKEEFYPLWLHYLKSNMK